MAKHEKNKAGLHKGISSIFKGVSIPQTDGDQKPSGTSAPERKDYTEHKPPVPDLQKSEVSKIDQATQMLLKADPEHTDYTEPKQPTPEPQKPQASKTNQVTPSLPKSATAQRPKTEPAQQPKTEPVHLPESMTAQQSKAEPTQESKADSEQKPEAEPAQKLKAEPVHLPEFVTTQESKAEPVQKPEAEPVQKSEAEPAQKPKTEPVHLPEFVTTQESKAEPVQKPEAEPVQKPEAEPAQKSEAKPVKQFEAEPAQQPKADIDKKVSKERPSVKISGQSFWQQIKNKVSAPKPGASSTKQKAMVVMMPLLLIVLIFMMFKGGVFGTSTGHTEASVEDTASGAVTAGANTKIDWKVPEVYPATLRDPMQLVESVTDKPETKIETKAEPKKTIGLIVKSILYSEDNPSAVISGRIVHEGETIRGSTVVEINRDSVEFEMNGKRWTQKVR